MKVSEYRSDVNTWKCTDYKTGCTVLDSLKFADQGLRETSPRESCNSQCVRVRELVSWCFKSSQPQRITSGLKETFIKRYIVQRTSKAEIRLEEQSEKAESCRENVWNEIQLNGP